MDYRALHERYSLPPPPPRSAWAVGRPHESQRAWLPDFDKTATPYEHLHHFLRIIFQPYLGKVIYVHCKVMAAVIACILLMLALIIGRRFYDRALWLFRLSQRSNGNLIVPNSITNLCLIILIYGCVLIAFDVIIVAWGDSLSPEHLFLWTTLIWLPLALGAYLGMLGVLMARPDALKSISPQFNREPSLALRLHITPRVVNLSFLTAPFVHVIAIAVPVYLADKHWQHALHQFHAWEGQYEGSTSLDRDMLLEAQDIWYEVLTASHWVCVAYVIWSITGALLGVAELFAGGSLALLVRRQIKTLRSFQQNQSFSETFAQQRERQLEQQAKQVGRIGAPSSHPKPSRFSIFALHRRFFKAGSSTDESYSESDDNEAMSHYFTIAEMERPDEPAPSFFPAVKPSTFKRPPKATRKNGRQAQRRYLQRFFVDILVQFVGITVGCFVYAGLGIAMALQWLSCWEANEGHIVLSQGILWANYGAVVCGGAIFTCILGRTYEPMLNNIAAHSANLRPKIKASMTASGSGSGSGQGQHRRRSTLAWAASAFSMRSGEVRSGHDQLQSQLDPRATTGAGEGAERSSPDVLLAMHSFSGGGKRDPDTASDVGTVLSEYLSSQTNLRRPSDRTLVTDDDHLKSQKYKDKLQGDDDDEKYLQHGSPRGPDASAATDAHGITVERTIMRSYERYEMDPVVGEVEVYHGGGDVGSPGHSAPYGFAPGTPSESVAASTLGGTPWTPATPWTPSSTTGLLSSGFKPYDDGKGQSSTSITSFLQPSTPAPAVTTPSYENRRSNSSGNSSGGRPSSRRGDGESRSGGAASHAVPRALVGLGIGEGHQSWTPPAAWDSPDADPALVAEEADRAQRTRTSRGQSRKSGRGSDESSSRSG